MKKIICLLLVLMLVGCGGKKVRDENEILTTDEGFPAINLNVLKKYIEPIELDLNNYKDIFDLVDNEIVGKDGYGNIVEVYSDKSYFPKEGYYYDIDDLYIILHDNVNDCDYTLRDLEMIKTQDDGTYEIRDVDETTFEVLQKVFNLDNVECTKVSGTVYKVTIPEEFIHNDTHLINAEGKCVDFYWYEEGDDGTWWSCLSLYNYGVKDFVEEYY